MDSGRLFMNRQLLGTIRIQSVDQPWLIYAFDPTPLYDSVSHLFSRELEILSDRSSPDRMQKWEQAYQKIKDLNIIIETDEYEFSDYLIHINGNIARIRYLEQDR
jgi:hypothetical protein